MTTELCKRRDGTTCGTAECFVGAFDEDTGAMCTVHKTVEFHHIDGPPARQHCTAPPVCWTCGKPIFWDEPDDWKHRSTPDEFLRNEHHSPADGTKPEPGQERCRRQKATECAQGRGLCDCRETTAMGFILACKDHAGVPASVDHHTDGSPCLGPECKAQPDEDPGTCIQCGAEFELVRPGKFQPTCECWDKPSEPIGTPIPPDSPLRHDTDDGPCECGAWHRPAEPGIVERAPLPARLRADASDLRGLVPLARTWSDTFKVIARNLDEAAARIEGLEGERRELYEAANANLGEGDEPVTSHEDLRVMLLEAYPNERYLRAENQRLREALEKIASFSDQDEMDSWRGTDTGNTDDAYEQGSENAYGACARIAREALKETP